MVKSCSANCKVSGIPLIPGLLLNYASFEGLYREENIYHDLGSSVDTESLVRILQMMEFDSWVLVSYFKRENLTLMTSS